MSLTPEGYATWNIGYFRDQDRRRANLYEARIPNSGVRCVCSEALTEDRTLGEQLGCN